MEVISPPAFGWRSASAQRSAVNESGL
jgi:hypothetical protein